jgi:hypothetical protein
VGRDGGAYEVIWAIREWKYFWKDGWTEKSLICPSANQPVARTYGAICGE